MDEGRRQVKLNRRRVRRQKQVRSHGTPFGSRKLDYQPPKEQSAGLKAAIAEKMGFGDDALVVVQEDKKAEVEE